MKIRDLNEANLGAEKDYVSPGVQQLKTDQYMGMYKFSKEVAGHDGKKQHAPKGEPNKVYKDAPVVVGYSDAEDKMTKAAMKGKVKQTVDAGSMEPPNVNKHSPLSKKKKTDEDKIKGADGKACWKGYRYNGTEKGKDKCVKVEDNVDEASVATMRKYFAGDEHAHDPSKTSTMRDFFSSPDNDNPIKPSRGKTFNSKGEYMRWLQAQKKTKENVEENVIYQLDPANPMDDTEVLVLGGAGRYTLAQLRNKARREALALAKDLETDHGDTFRKATYNIKQLTNTLNTIVAAYDELTAIRKKGGAKSRGIRAEDAKVFAESFDLMEKWSQKYKNSINCSNPKGFSQKAHCAGRKK